MKTRSKRHFGCEWRGLPYIALEEQNFLWKPEEVDEFDRLWSEGMDIKSMCKYFNRTEDDMALLIMDRAIKNEIKPRTYGIWGGSYERN